MSFHRVVKIHKMKFTLLIPILLSITNGYKILYLLPMASKSQRFLFDPVIEELAKRNHSVTTISLFRGPHLHENIHEIIIENPITDINKFSKSLFTTSRTNAITAFAGMKHFAKPFCEAYLKNSQVQLLLKEGKQFHVVIVNAVMNECALATAPLLANHVILHSPSTQVPWTPSIVPLTPSYIPLSMTSYGSKMSFFERVLNALTLLTIHLMAEYDYKPTIQSVITENFPQNPLIIDAEKKICLTLTNADPVITSARPSVPNIVSVGGGTHVQKGKQLSQELEDFINTAGDDGFILFSLGSNIQSKDLPEETKKGILKAFSKLKQNVIWKYEKKFEDLPKNVLVSKWLPQQDILAHPKLRLFITHGGMLSLQESVFNAVPLVAVPFFAEQPGNVARVEEIGIGIKLEFADITEETLFETINKVLTDKSYSANAKKYSAVFHDHLKGQLENAIYWIEYVVRFDGTAHLGNNAAQELSLVEYFLLDVVAFIFIVTIICKRALRKLCFCKQAQ